MELAERLLAGSGRLKAAGATGILLSGTEPRDAGAGASLLRRIDMIAPGRRRAAVFIVPLITGFVTAQRAAPNVRAVDFVLLFAAGLLCGVSLVGLIQTLRSSRGAGG